MYLVLWCCRGLQHEVSAMGKGAGLLLTDGAMGPALPLRLLAAGGASVRGGGEEVGEGKLTATRGAGACAWQGLGCLAGMGQS